MPPLYASDLIFSEQANHNFSKTLSELKRHNLSIRNRLQSILEDAAFVQQVSAAYGRPLIANERCGSWYIDPKHKHSSAYFKSTDGHTGVWSFSTRRLNIHLLEIIGRYDGCIIVDSTRRGKRMPDALSKTIPIWCAVLNRALFLDRIDSHDFYAPPQVISSSEHAQITARLDGFLQSFLALEMDRVQMRAQITKPLRPIWLTPESHISCVDTVFEDYHPIICCTASRRVLGVEVSEGGYIQGSGDDTENWAFGLTSSTLWANAQLLLSVPEIDLPELIPKLVAGISLTSQASTPTPIPPTTNLHITDLKTASGLPSQQHRFIISLLPETTPVKGNQATPPNINISIGPHKVGSRNLRSALPIITDFVSKHIIQENSNNKSGPEINQSIIVACLTGKDHSIGAALALLCLFYGNDGHLFSGLKEGRDPGNSTSRPKISKLYIRQRLGWIMTALPTANPSGATLQTHVSPPQLVSARLGSHIHPIINILSHSASATNKATLVFGRALNIVQRRKSLPLRLGHISQCLNTVNPRHGDAKGVGFAVRMRV